MQVTFDPTNAVEAEIVRILLNLDHADTAKPGVAENNPGSDGRHYETPHNVTAEGEAEQDAGNASPVPLADAPKKRGRKPKAKAAPIDVAVEPEPEQIVWDDPAPEEKPVVEEKPATEDQVRIAMKKYMDQNGMEKAIKILKDHGVDRISDLAAGDYNSVIKACGV